MGEKDITEKLLEDYDDVFADIINVLLFDGKRLMGEDELSNTKDRSQYKLENEVHDQERDVSKFWRKGEIRIAFCGMENQTDIDEDMPLRVISYDGAAYKAQLVIEDRNKRKKREKNRESGKETVPKTDKQGAILRYPAVTLVLYFGYKERWSGKTTLLECLQIPEDLKPYVSDYKINVFEIAYLTDEQVAMFQSDFRIVADYFVQMRKNRRYKPSRETLRHVDEVLKLMKALTQDERFVEAQNEAKGDVKNMCEALDKLVDQGREEGRLEGRTELETGIIQTMLSKGITAEAIASMTDIPLERIRQVAANV